MATATATATAIERTLGAQYNVLEKRVVRSAAMKRVGTNAAMKNIKA
jgi:hypothetical protein